MARVQGIARIRRVAKVLVVTGMSLAIFAIVLALISTCVSWLNADPIAVGVLYLGLFPLLLGSALWLVAWVLEGFLMPPSEP